MSLTPFFDMWPQYNRRMIEVVAPMTAEELALRPHPERWPIWATVAHTAGGRVYWLCGVFGEPGIEEAPFIHPSGVGWEDDLDTPRRADELVSALEMSWAVVEGCLERWTPEMLTEPFLRDFNGVQREHVRGEVLQRLFTHDAYHCGELSQTLGIAGRPQIDLWRSE